MSELFERTIKHCSVAEGRGDGACECLEDAVRRELAEEAGVRVSSVRYQASQAWPFPAGLMIGFRALAVSDSVAVDGNELIEARWFTREQVMVMLASGNNRVDSIEHFLVTSWLRETP